MSSIYYLLITFFTGKNKMAMSLSPQPLTAGTPASNTNSMRRNINRILLQLLKLLSSKEKYLKSKGKDNRPNKADMIETSEEETMWDKGALGDLSTKCMGMRGRQESRQLRM